MLIHAAIAQSVVLSTETIERRMMDAILDEEDGGQVPGGHQEPMEDGEERGGILTVGKERRRTGVEEEEEEVGKERRRTGVEEEEEEVGEREEEDRGRRGGGRGGEREAVREEEAAEAEGGRGASRRGRTPILKGY